MADVEETTTKTEAAVDHVTAEEPAANPDSAPDPEAAPKDPADAAAKAAAAKKKKKEKEKAKKEKDKEHKEKDEKKDAKKKPKTMTSDLIKQAMKLRLEEEEKARKKQEEEEKRLRELEEQRLQKLKEEQERKERKKQKEKERVERLKKEGKYLNPEQKQKLARQREMVEMMKQQGLIVGHSGDLEKDGDEDQQQQAPVVARKPKYGNKRNNNKNKLGTNNNAAESVSKEPSPVDENATAESVALKKVQLGSEKVNEDDDDNVAESWDLVELEKPEAAENGAEKVEDEKKDSADDEESDSAEESESSSDIAEITETKSEKIATNQDENQKPKEKESVPDRIKRRTQERLTRKSLNVLRSPVICVLGHVDTGKTKILDKIRQTHVQDSEAGGITQQIGATMVPADAIKEQGKMVKDFDCDKLELPGFLIIDTPGHESFSNLRSRGSSLCDIAILVVDIMHGLEPQTIESLNMLKKRKTPFIVALNKVDRLYEWKSNPKKDIRNVLKAQQSNTQIEFQDRFKDVQFQFAQQAVNIALFWENKDYGEYVSVCPTSAHSGDGMGNLMCALAQIAQTQHRERLAYCEHLQCSVLEVKALPGLGTTIDVILVNGCLHVGDTIIVAGMEGPIVTQIRELLMPQPLREMRVKNPYEHFKEVRGAQGIKILAKDFDKALAGISLMVAENDDEIDYFKEEVNQLLEHTLHSIKLCDKGVYVQASTLGSLEALLEFLRSQKIPYSGINIGPVHKKDVMKASAMLEHDAQWAVILAFDVKIEREAELMADELGVRIFHADIIYHLQDAFVKYREELRLKKRQEHAHLAIFPCKLRVLPQHVFKTRDPIVVGVAIDDGVLKVGTPLCVPSKDFISLGTVSSIESNAKPLETARKGQEVAIKIENTTGDAPKMYGRHFDYQDIMVSKITRETIDVCKQYFRDDLQKSDWQLIVELKKVFGIL